MKKKLESDVTELEVSLEHSNSANQEIQKTIKHYHQQIRDVQTGLEEEARLKDVSRDLCWVMLAEVSRPKPTRS